MWEPAIERLPCRNKKNVLKFRKMLLILAFFTPEGLQPSHNLCHSDLFRMERSRITQSYPVITWSTHATHSWFQYRCQQGKKDRGKQTSSYCAITAEVRKKKTAHPSNCDKAGTKHWNQTLSVQPYRNRQRMAGWHSGDCAEHTPVGDHRQMTSVVTCQRQRSNVTQVLCAAEICSQMRRAWQIPRAEVLDLKASVHMYYWLGFLSRPKLRQSLCIFINGHPNCCSHQSGKKYGQTFNCGGAKSPIQSKHESNQRSSSARPLLFLSVASSPLSCSFGSNE